MVICGSNEEVLETINNNAIPCVVTYSKDFEDFSKLNTGYSITKFQELENIIIC
jgi:hypothetical protein